MATTKKFTWDEAKRRSNLVKRRLDFADAPVVFAGITFTFEDDRFDYGEERFITLGMLKGVVVVIAHTERNEAVRIISMRKATKHEQKLYFQEFTN
ncbi:MAG: BrnT family toxin [Anaerolineales bacterium]|nr:BrnT family toxin [Anaerolineales bacterium]